MFKVLSLLLFCVVVLSGQNQYESITITSAPDIGLSFTVIGAGCSPGNYTSPAPLTWTIGATCIVYWLNPQSPNGDVQYTFVTYEEFGYAANPASFISTVPPGGSS